MNAQSTAYVFQFGPTIGLQKWDNSFEREPLFKYHGALSIESVDNEDDKNSLFMQIGYHIKGSANRFRYFNINSGAPSGSFTEEFRFNNLSLVLGAKQKRPFGASGNARFFLWRRSSGRLHLIHQHRQSFERQPHTRAFLPQCWIYEPLDGGIYGHYRY